VSEPRPRRTFLDHLALWLSVLLSPFVCVPYFCVVFAQATARSSTEFYHLAAICTVLSIGVPAGYIAYNVHRGYITDLHVKLLEQRRGPFRAGMVGLGLLFLSLWIYGAPPRLTSLSAVLFCQAFLFEAISRKWKISMHTSILSGCLAASIELAAWSPASLWVLVPLSWARYRRGRHLWSQAFSGAALGYGLTIYPLRWLFSL
jgi:hypothetical protein